MLFKIIAILMCLTYFVVTVKCSSVRNGTVVINVDKELILTQKEKNAFVKFKSDVWDTIPEEYGMAKTDLYLLRLLRAKNLDVQQSKRDLYEFFQHIRDNNLLNILKEGGDFTDLEHDHPLHFVIDKMGRPTLFASTEEGWDLRRTVLQGKSARMRRYLYKSVYELYERVKVIQAAHPNVTQGNIIVDLIDFSVYQQGCPSCIVMYIQFMELWEKWIPGVINEIILINSGPALYIVLSSVRPFLSQQTRESIKVFGGNVMRWKLYLKKRYDMNQLPFLQHYKK